MDGGAARGGHTVTVSRAMAGLNDATLRRHANALGGMFLWACQRNLYEGDNPFQGQPEKKEGDDAGRS